MVSNFYKKYSAHLLLAVAILFPVLLVEGESLPVNNEIETWLPKDSQVRVAYDEFKRLFGVEEVILVALSDFDRRDPLVEALCRRIERLPGIRQCWSPGRLETVMKEFGVAQESIDERLRGLVVAESGNLIGLVALLSPAGLEDRAATVASVREQVRYCQLADDQIALSGAPILVSELDRLGSRANNQGFFVITLLIAFGLLYCNVRDCKLSLAVLGLTVWAINLTMAAIKWSGGEMNFILGALSVMVMIFTLAVSIHFLHYCRASIGRSDPLGAALRLAWKPCFLATLTTTIGLISLTLSDIAPVRQFGYAASIGCVVALVTGLGLTPAALTLWPDRGFRPKSEGGWFTQAADWLIDHRIPVAAVAGVTVLGACVGVLWIDSKIDPLDFLPGDSKVLADVRRIERRLTNTSSIEAVVDFGDRDLQFAEKLEEVRRLEAIIGRHPAVRHTMSVATFFPNEMPHSPLETARLLKQARSREDNNAFMTAGDRRWRISARIRSAGEFSRTETLGDLAEMTAGAPVAFTGIAPLLEGAQRTIFDGFWTSFGMAFAIITLVMVVALRSLKLGLIAMIPNLTPIGLVFGLLGWLEIPVDIGMMMTGSIALGIAVDGTFHYLVRFEEQQSRNSDAPRSARIALVKTGAPIFKAAAIASIGMLALTLSNFTPTAKFGYMMATLLMAALIGDLVLLPTILALLRSEPAADQPPTGDSEHERRGPHMLRSGQVGSRVSTGR